MNTTHISRDPADNVGDLGHAAGRIERDRVELVGDAVGSSLLKISTL